MNNLISRLRKAVSDVNALGVMYELNISANQSEVQQSKQDINYKTPLSGLIRYGKIAIVQQLSDLAYHQPISDEFTEERKSIFQKTCQDSTKELLGLEQKLVAEFDQITAANSTRDYQTEISTMLQQFKSESSKVHAPIGDETYSTLINYYKSLEVRKEHVQFEIEYPRIIPAICDELVSMKGKIQLRINTIRKYVSELDSITIEKPTPTYDVNEDFNHLGGR